MRRPINPMRIATQRDISTFSRKKITARGRKKKGWEDMMMVLSDKGIKLTDQQALPIAPTPRIARQKCIQGREVLNKVAPWESMRGRAASMPKKKRKKEI
jgi:hypothetical protein